MRVGIAWLLVVVALGLTSRGFAQAPPAPQLSPSAQGAEPANVAPAAPASSPPAGSTAAESSPLDTFLLRDSKGNLVPVLGMPFEEFEQLWRMKKGLVTPTGPGFTLDSLTLAGTADRTIANLQMKATIRLRAEGWVRIPLQIRGAVIRESPQLEGGGEHFLTFDENAGGYVCWLKGANNLPQVLSLQTAVGLSAVGDETRLSLTLPRATESSLRLTVPDKVSEAVLLAGDGIAATRQLPEQRSEVTVLGAGGELQLSWRKGRAAASAATNQLEATGEILVRVESEHRITSDARLRVRSFGAPLEVFTVQLPLGMDLVPISAAGYSSVPLPAEGDTTDTKPAGQLVEVRLDKPTSGAVEVRLLASLDPEAAIGDALMPARFDVRGAVRQRGTIDFAMEGDWQLRWKPDTTVRRLDPTGATATRVVARFDYFRQPCGLQLSVAPQPSRVSVEPSHVLHIDARQMRLETTLKYRFRGAPTAGIALDVGDWKVQRLAPEEWFETQPLAADGTGRAQASFRSGSVPPPELELKLEAIQELRATAGRISVTFPRPVADAVAPAAIIVDAADNVELTPLGSELVGLLPEPTTLRIPGRQKAPFMFRELAGGEAAKLTAGFRVLSRLTTASARAHVRFERDRLEIEQRLHYHVAHVPQREFTIVVPEELAIAGRVQVWQQDQALDVIRLDNSAVEDELPRLRFVTAAEQLGDFEVAVRYATAAPPEVKSEARSMVVPLVVPAEEEGFHFNGQEIAFALSDGIQIEPAVSESDEAFKSIESLIKRAAFRWSQALTTTDWMIRTQAAESVPEIRIAKAWIQSWLGASGREERVSWRLTTNQDALRIRLPTGVSLGSVQAAIDARQVRIEVRGPIVRLEWPASARGREAVLELWYQVAPPPRRLGMSSGQLVTAQLEGAASPRRTYWQVALPENRYLLTTSGSLEQEMAWNASRWPMTRRPVLDQLQLESWLGASRQDSLPRGINDYLFGTLGQAPALDLVVADRRLLIALGSAVALLFGLLWLHVPRFRSPNILVAVVCLLGATALAAPDAAILVAQWSLAGVLVTFAAAGWHWLAAGRSRPVSPPVVLAPARHRDGSSTQPLIMQSARGSSRMSAASAVGSKSVAELTP